MTKSNSTEQAVDRNNDAELDLEGWVDELYTDGFREAMVKSGLDALTIPSYASQTNLSTMNNSPSFRGGSSDKSQCGIPQEMMTMTSMTPNSSTTTVLQRSGHSRPPVPKFGPNPVAQSSQSRRTTDMPQFQHQNQPLKQQVLEHNAVQQPPTHSRMDQSTINIIGQKNHNQHQRMPADQFRPSPRPVSTIQTAHLQNPQALRQQRQHQMVQPLQNFQQNQNQRQLQLQQPTPTSHILIPEGGRPRVQGLVIGEGRRRPPEHRQGIHPYAILGNSQGHFSPPTDYPSPEAWREYVFRQIVQMKGKYMSDLLKMHKKSVLLLNEETNSMELKRKYEHAKEFLEKIITFLNVPTVDMIPPNDERVYNYMNFIVNYMISYMKKNGGSSSSQNSEQVHQPPRGQQLHPNGDNIKLQYNPQSNLSQGVVNLDSNMVNFNQKPIHQPSSSQSKGPQLQPNGEMKLPHMLPPSSSQRIANPDTNMGNFNQNFPSRRPHGRVPGSSSFQVGIEQRSANPLLIGSFKGAQPDVLGTTQQSNLGPNTSNVVNFSGSPMSLLKAATTANFPSRQLTHQQPSLSNQNFNSEKMKQPMHKMNELTDQSKVGRAMSPLGSRLTTNQLISSPSPSNPIFQSPQLSSPCSLPSVSSWQVVNANSILSPESIARSPFLLGSSSSPSHREKQLSSSGLSPLSTLDSQRPEIPIIAGLFGDQQIIKNQVPDMGPPRAPTPSTDKTKESQHSKDAHHRLMEAIKSLSSSALGSSLMDISSVNKSIDWIPADSRPTKHINGDIDDITNFLLNCENMELEGRFNSISDNESTNFIFSDMEDDSAFLLEYEEGEPERKVKRKLTITSASKSQPEFSDYDSFKHFFTEDIESSVTSIKKKPKIECMNAAILAEIEEINSKLLETSMEMVLKPSEDTTSILGGHEGITVTCLYKNVCSPDLSDMKPEFRIQLHVPVNYPASSPTILNTSQNVSSSGPWAKLYDETVSRFERSVRELRQQMSLGDMARKWEACARDVITEFAQRVGGNSFSLKYGSWESSSGSS